MKAKRFGGPVNIDDDLGGKVESSYYDKSVKCLTKSVNYEILMNPLY